MRLLLDHWPIMSKEARWNQEPAVNNQARAGGCSEHPIVASSPSSFTPALLVAMEFTSSGSPISTVSYWYNLLLHWTLGTLMAAVTDTHPRKWHLLSLYSTSWSLFFVFSLQRNTRQLLYRYRMDFECIFPVPHNPPPLFKSSFDFYAHGVCIWYDVPVTSKIHKWNKACYNFPDLLISINIHYWQLHSLSYKWHNFLYLYDWKQIPLGTSPTSSVLCC